MSPRRARCARRGLSLISSLGQFLTLQGIFLLGAFLGTVVAIFYATSLPLLLLRVIVFSLIGVFLLAGITGIVLTCLVMEHKRSDDTDEGNPF